MDPQLMSAAMAADGDLAAQTADFALQSAIAQCRPDLVAALARNPYLYPDLRVWVDSLTSQPAVTATEPTQAQPEPQATPQPQPQPAEVTQVQPVDVAQPQPVEVTQPRPQQQAGPQPGPQRTSVLPQSQPQSAAPVQAEFPPQPAAPAQVFLQAAPTQVMPQLPSQPQPAVPQAQAPGSFPAAPEAEVAGQLPAGQLPAGQFPSGAFPGGAPQPGVPGDGSTSQPASAPRSRKGRVIAIVVVIVLLVAAGAGAGAWYLLRGRDADSAGGGTSSTASASEEATTQAEAASAAPSVNATATRCDKDPKVSVVRATGQNTLDVTLHLTPSCDTDVLGGKSNQVTVTSGGDTIALGLTDFSTAPVTLTADGTDVVVSFPAGRYYRPAGALSVSGLAASVVADRSSGPQEAEVAQPAASYSVSEDPARGDDAEQAAEAALRVQADQDLVRARSTINGGWVPQISSKRPGLVLDGQTWTNQMVYDHYLQMRQTYPNVLLLRSQDWPVFDPGEKWWVIVVGQTFGTAEEANAWCDAQGIGKEDCFAKRVVSTGDPEGTTVMR